MYITDQLRGLEICVWGPRWLSAALIKHCASYHYNHTLRMGKMKLMILAYLVIVPVNM